MELLVVNCRLCEFGFSLWLELSDAGTKTGTLKPRHLIRDWEIMRMRWFVLREGWRLMRIAWEKITYCIRRAWKKSRRGDEPQRNLYLRYLDWNGNGIDYGVWGVNTYLR